MFLDCPSAVDPSALALLEDGLMTVKEAVQFSRLSRSELYQRMERGDLAYVKLGKRRLIPKKALVELAARHLVQRQSEG